MSELMHYPVAFRPGTRLPASIDDPQAVNRAIAAVAQPDGLAAADIVSAASDPASPIHAAFEWDDAVAGDKYREGQAFYLAGSLIDTRTGQRVYVSRYAETNNPADIGRIRINVRLLPQPERSTAPQPQSYTVRTAPQSIEQPVRIDMSPEVVEHTPDEERSLIVFRRWVDAHRHDPAVLRAAMRILRETL